MSRRTLSALAAILVQLALLAAAPAARATEFGLSDQQAVTWSDPRVRGLGLRHARLIIPWDAATSEPARVQAWLDGVAAAGLQPHIVFGLLRTDRCPSAPCVLPTREQYRAAVDAFRTRWPQVTTFTTWNEANHFTQPVRRHPEAAAAFWVELAQACPGCTIVGADVLDSSGYVRWLERFKKAVPTLPRLWSIHNYADATYGSSVGTDKVLSMVPGQLWVEETGGIVSLRDDQGRPTFSANEARAAASIDQAFAIARARPRITRMYLYHWKAHTLLDTFDAGLVRPDGTARLSLLRAAENIKAATGAPVGRSATPQVTVAARWSTRRGALLLTLRCRAASGTCRGTATVTAETRRAPSALRTTRLATTRTYRTTRGRRSVTLSIAVSRATRSRIRAASNPRLSVALRATQPEAARGDLALRLPRPLPQPQPLPRLARLARGCRLLPGPAAFEFDLEREGERGSDQHDAREDGHGLQRGGHRDRADDVGGHQDLQSEEDRPTDVLPQRPVEIDAAATPTNGADRGPQHPDDDHRHAKAINGLANDLDRFLKLHPANVAATATTSGKRRDSTARSAVNGGERR